MPVLIVRKTCFSFKSPKGVQKQKKQQKTKKTTGLHITLLYTEFECNTKPGLHISLLNTKYYISISFLTLVIVQKLFFFFSDLDPRGSRCNTNPGLHISLLDTKFYYNISCLALVIVWTPVFYFK
jgi:hypothetical protein